MLTVSHRKKCFDNNIKDINDLIDGTTMHKKVKNKKRHWKNNLEPNKSTLINLKLNIMIITALLNCSGCHNNTFKM